MRIVKIKLSSGKIMEKEKIETEKGFSINTYEMIDYWFELQKYAKRKKIKPAKFNYEEFDFLFFLILFKPKGLLFYYLADHLMNETAIKNMPMFNAPSVRKLKFIYNFISGARTAKEAAIKAGFSPKTAVQQASRILWEINGRKRKS